MHEISNRTKRWGWQQRQFEGDAALQAHIPGE